MGTNDKKNDEDKMSGSANENSGRKLIFSLGSKKTKPYDIRKMTGVDTDKGSRKDDSEKDKKE